MNIFDTQDYRQFIEFQMGGESTRAWGSVKKLATALKCHSTYVSQIIKGRAHFSIEQALAFCKFMRLDRDSTDHMIDLVSRDRAGNQDVRDYFQSRIERRLNDRLNLKKRLEITESLTLDQEAKYYNGWLPQAVHVCCQLPGPHTSTTISRLLKVGLDEIESVLNDLELIGLIEFTQKGITCLKDIVHLGKDSDNIGRFHINWRLRTVSDLLTRVRLQGTHYSSVVTLSLEAARQLQEMVVAHIEESRALIVSSPSDHIYVYCLDFYPLTLSPSK